MSRRQQKGAKKAENRERKWWKWFGMNDNDGISTHPTMRIGPGYVGEGRRRVRVVGEREKEEKERK